MLNKLNCIICNKPLKGRQVKYCSKGCESTVWRRANPELNKQYSKIANKRNQDKRREYVYKLKEDTPCTDCNQNYPYYVMQFDHISGVKVHHVSQMIQRGWQPLKDEIAKCEIVCSNCHAERTHRRRHSITE